MVLKTCACVVPLVSTFPLHPHPHSHTQCVATACEKRAKDVMIKIKSTTTGVIPVASWSVASHARFGPDYQTFALLSVEMACVLATKTVMTVTMMTL